MVQAPRPARKSASRDPVTARSGRTEQPGGKGRGSNARGRTEELRRKSIDAPPRSFATDPSVVLSVHLFDTEEGFPMGAKDTVVNRSRQVRGKIKDIIGKAIGNPKMRASGHRDMVAGEVKQRGSVAKDRLTDL
jgi:uncharacterized protein YjbJ (UPF0337 family)